MRFAFGSGTSVKVGLEIRAAKRITALTSLPVCFVLSKFLIKRAGLLRLRKTSGA